MLAHRLIDKILLYAGVRPLTFSNHFSSEAVRPILSILCGVEHLQMGKQKVMFCSNRIRTLVASATYSFHILIMVKVEIGNFYCFIGETIDGMKMKLHVYVHDISICITCVFYCRCSFTFVAMVTNGSD